MSRPGSLGSSCWARFLAALAAAAAAAAGVLNGLPRFFLTGSVAGIAMEFLNVEPFSFRVEAGPFGALLAGVLGGRPRRGVDLLEAVDTGTSSFLVKPKTRELDI